VTGAGLTGFSSLPSLPSFSSFPGSILMSDKSHTDLGTKEIYKRHAVMVEGGTMPRAKVMDQTLIDRYLMDGLISLSQHQAAEYIMSQALQAGLYTKPLSSEPSSGERAKDAIATESLMRYGRTLDLISKRFGPYHKYLVEEVVLHGWDVSLDAKKMGTLKEGLDWISDRRLAGGRNPLKRLRESR